MTSLESALHKLIEYCEKANYEGWDPYDGLNSKLFQATLFKKSPFARLVWIQLFKRNPINLRNLFDIKKGYNPKGLALFLIGYCNLNSMQFEDDYLLQINYLSEKLIELQSKGYSGACWGYNFDWQTKSGLYFPAWTPTVVATTFCATALFQAYSITGNEKYLNTALSSANFIIHDLNRTKKDKGFLFSYSPLKGNDTVYNASLLGSKLLSNCYYYTKNKEYAGLANESVAACVGAQAKDGSWIYGELPTQDWIDSFHTGYNLESLNDYQCMCQDYSYSNSINKGFAFYIENFFLKNGTPKYYNDKIHPIDIHCPAQFFVTISKLNNFIQNRDLAQNVMNWTINNLHDNRGYFYYQKHKYYTIKIPYMRWSQAFIFYGFSYYLKELMMHNKSKKE